MKRMGLVLSFLAASAVLLLGFQNCTQGYRSGKQDNQSSLSPRNNGNGYDGKVYKSANDQATCADGIPTETELLVPAADPNSVYLTREECKALAQPVKIEATKYVLINHSTIKYISKIMNYTDPDCDFMIGSEAEFGPFMSGSVYCLSNDIVFTQPVPEVPVISDATLDGKGFTLKNLQVPTTGLFRSMAFSVVKNLTLDNPNFYGDILSDRTGLLSGNIYNTTIMHVTVTNVPDLQLSSTYHTGFLLGYVFLSSLQNISIQSPNSLTISDSMFGGVVAASTNNTSLSDISVDFASITLNQVTNAGVITSTIADTDSYPPVLADFQINVDNLIMTGSGDGGVFGALAGRTDINGYTLSNAKVTGNFQLSNISFAGGFFGWSNGRDEPCSVFGADLAFTMSATMPAAPGFYDYGIGGLYGKSEGTSSLTLTDVKSSTTINVTASNVFTGVAGLVGQNASAGGLNVVNATGLSTISSSGTSTFNVGRMQGNALYPVNVVNSTFQATHNGVTLP